MENFNLVKYIIDNWLLALNFILLAWMIKYGLGLIASFFMPSPSYIDNEAFKFGDTVMFKKDMSAILSQTDPKIPSTKLWIIIKESEHSFVVLKNFQFPGIYINAFPSKLSALSRNSAT